MTFKALSWLRGRWAMAAVVAVVAAVLLGNRGFRRVVVHALQLRRLGTEMSTLKKEEAELKAAVSAAKLDDLALEKAARKELGYLKPGEVEYRFPPPGKK